MRALTSPPATATSPFQSVPLKDRTWPDKRITKAPRWASSDLRDGNQALVNPMTIEQKQRVFNLYAHPIFALRWPSIPGAPNITDPDPISQSPLHSLLKCGFKEIEAGFPSASETEFSWIRGLIEKDQCPDDVWLQVRELSALLLTHVRTALILLRSNPQVLSPAREELIRRTMAGVRDAKNVIFHMYNAAAPVFREQVFGNSKEQTIALAVKHVKLVRELVDEAIARGDRTKWQFEYSPEAFSQTEPEFAVELCNAVQEAWFAGKDKSKEAPIIFNLPATVEVATPNNYADQVSGPPCTEGGRALTCKVAPRPCRSSTSAATSRTASTSSSRCTPTTTAARASLHLNSA